MEELYSAYINRSYTLLKNNSIDDSDNDCERARLLYNNRLPTYVCLIEIQHERERHTSAISVAEQGIIHNKTSSILYYLKANSLYALGLTDEALETINTAIDLSVTDDQRYLSLVDDADYKGLLEDIEESLVPQ